MLRDRVVLGAEVIDALAEGHPIVALESTLITHGLPYPDNLQVATGAEDAVRQGGAVPATVAVQDGRLLFGLTRDQIEEMADAPRGTVAKASRPTLAAALSSPGWAGTTVSATMMAARAVGVQVFATGGIGGVHRGSLGGDAPSFDISSDLEELARTPVVVVCAGPKAILDIRATVEYLETRGVPVLTIGTAEIPGFFTRSSGVPSPISLPDVQAAAGLGRLHLGLGLDAGMLVCVPVPEVDALTPDRAQQAIDRALEEADREGVSGSATTPWLLARVAELTGGDSVRANKALIVNNARVAGELALSLAHDEVRSA
jgi:pseudouridine-5'-phosphate glycosidase